jgi:hypothetical protein
MKVLAHRSSDVISSAGDAFFTVKMLNAHRKITTGAHMKRIVIPLDGSPVPITSTHAAGQLGGAISSPRFLGSDRIDDHELNDILYQGIQGRPAPPTVRSIFAPRVTSDELE